MKRARKSSKKAKQKVDRLSALPDEVICHILSFLPTKLSMETSILAKRWRFLWAHVLVLDFEFYNANPKKATFPGIVNTVILRHKVASLTTFRLTYTGAHHNDIDGPTLGRYEHASCIATVVERNVQNLYLALRVEVPRCLLTCKTLVDLTMFEDVSMPPSSGPIYLPNLKKLHLWDLNCEVDFTRLISGCPVLEELIIEGTTCHDPKGCCISSPTLKRLTIVYLVDRSKYNDLEYMVTINTPALKYLKVRDRSSKHISISPCTSLVEADIHVYTLCEPGDFYHRRVLKLLDSVCNVKCLTLSGFRGKIRDGLMLGSTAKFDNLTKLELSAPWCFLTKFLETAQHLQVLSIFEDDSDSKNWMDPIEGLLNSLRTVRIDGFRCIEQGFDMVRYVLRNAQELERMEINSSCVDWKEKFEAVRKITQFRRESKKCELDFD